jgi:hypothetical protein
MLALPHYDSSNPPKDTVLRQRRQALVSRPRIAPRELSPPPTFSTVSVVPPAENGTTMVITLSGKACAYATVGVANARSARTI